MDGLDRLDPSRDTFTHYRHDPEPKKLDQRSMSLVSIGIGAANCGSAPAAGLTVWTRLPELSSTTGTTLRIPAA